MSSRIFRKALKYHLAESGEFDSQKTLAITAGVSEGMISAMLSGGRNYGGRSHLKVANACGYRLEDFYKLGLAIEERHPIGGIGPPGKIPAATGKNYQPPPNTDKEITAICTRLLEIKSADPNVFKNVKAYIAGARCGLLRTNSKKIKKVK